MYQPLVTLYTQASSTSNMTVSGDNILLRGMGDVTLEGRSVNFTAASGITLQSERVRNSPNVYVMTVLFLVNYYQWVISNAPTATSSKHRLFTAAITKTLCVQDNQ